MPFQPTEDLIIEQEGEVAILTMNCPETKNAFSDDLHIAMQEVWLSLIHI